MGCRAPDPGHSNVEEICRRIPAFSDRFQALRCRPRLCRGDMDPVWSESIVVVDRRVFLRPGGRHRELARAHRRGQIPGALRTPI